MTIEQLLTKSIKRLSSCSSTPELDSEIFLAKALNVPRIYLKTWPERSVLSSVEQIFEQWVERRHSGEPVAYIIGNKEFWDLDLLVTPAVLVPRPETELLIEIALSKLSKQTYSRVIDLGTGSGAIAIALAKSRPNCEVLGTDISSAALNVARENAIRYELENIKFYQGHWFSALRSDDRKLFDLVVSNPPYIAEQDPHLQHEGLPFEPQQALVAKQGGLSDLKHIVLHASTYIKEGGWLMVEHGYNQKNSVCEYFTRAGFAKVESIVDTAGVCRVVVGQRV